MPPTDPPPSPDEGVEPSPAHRHHDGVVSFDTLMGGLTDVTAGYLLEAPRPTLIECGPARTIEHLVAGLRAHGLDPDDLAHLVLTHIHLDHAGGAGDVAAAFPNATIVVSDVGARHLNDPGRLNDSARRVYGGLYDRIYGDCTPIDADRIVGAEDGHVLDLGAGRELTLLYTPGHAKHHLAAHDSGTGAIFSGDAVGVRLPGMKAIRPATPPADFHLEAALASIERFVRLEPTRVYLAHYGPVDPADEALAEADDRLRLWAATAEAAWRVSSELDHVAETLQARFQSEIDAAALPGDPQALERVNLLSGYESNAAGLIRYFTRRDNGTLTEVG